MAPATAPKEVSEPFPISCIAGRHLLFDVDTISHVRRNHNICGVLVGTIPNLSQQNVFLGIPLQLMPEEARVLVEGGHAYIVDDVETHRQGFQEMSRADRMKYLADMDRQGVEAANESLAAQERKKDVALKKKGLRRDAETETVPSVADSIATVESTAPSVADSTASNATVHVELPSPTGSGLGFIMKGSGFLEHASPFNASSGASAPLASSVSSSTVASDLGSSFVDLGSIMKGSSFFGPSSATVKSGASEEATESGNDATASSPQTFDGDSSLSDLGSIMKGSSFLDSVPVEMKVERVELEEATPLLVKEEDATPEEIKAEEAQLEEAMLNEFEAQAVEDPQEVAPVTTEAKPELAADPEEVDPSTTETSIFDPEPATSTPTVKSTTSKSVFSQRQYITPTTSTPPLPTPAKDESRALPVVPKSYPLFRFLHSRGYFFMPGLRFGCNYSVYPGDPLRYHSHFLATGLGWDEKFDLLDIVGGGRLGTGTKKAYMVGGEDPKAPKEDGKDPVRAFSVEWASM
ncbi:tRNA-intron lyase [Ascochyta rabiei]|uniref:tRNA-intron lyase n=1 Tax=Didymella rabiei TaxID=5454 RepID=A0A162X973_DIDRA|nr:tRNA-intron lyase [Ascochyta rabiei]KZM19415.1 nucleic acid binding [Ascochyta rabiei]UPX18744.1 tRNA-intron lyase [Ascochyta rabiei]